MIRKTLIAAALLAVAAPVLAAGEAKNVIFFLGDGYGPVTYTAARIYSVGEDGSLVTDTFPYTARVRTYSLDAQTTDSAPSMAAYTTGVKTRNETLAMDGSTLAIPYAPSAATVSYTDTDGSTKTETVSNAKNNCPASGNGAASTTVLELAKAKGKGTGVVTTARLTHATPAATYAHICHRNAEYDISVQAVPGGAGFNSALGNGIDVLMGGVSNYWRPYNHTVRPKGRPDGRDLVAELQSQGYQFFNDRPGMLAAPADGSKKLIGLFDMEPGFSDGHMSYDLDRDPNKEPSLAEMTSKAIDVLSKNSNGYYLMVEAGRIDHALHATNAKRALQDAEALDQAIRTAVSKVDLSNTLIVVTADHDHTMAFNGYGKRGTNILGLNVDYKSGQPSTDANGINYTTLVFGNGSGGKSIPTSTAATSGNRPDTRSNQSSATVTANDYRQEVVIRTSGGNNESHGSGDVFLFATGAGSNSFKGTIDNTKVFTLTKAAAGY